MNQVLKRRSRVPANATDIPPYGICNAQICSGVNYVLNPAPIVSPNVDTMYGGAWLDTNNAMFLQIPNAALLGGARYYSVNFLDAYTNIITTISNENYPNGGLFCLYGGNSNPQGQIDRCNTVASNGHRTITAFIQLPRYSFGLVRVYSTGADSGRFCGPEGCVFMDGVGIQSLQTNAILAPFNAYKSYFAPNSASACSYHYGQKPCVNGDRNAFWNLVCKIIGENPPSADEAEYINNKFASVGLTTSCASNTLDYATLNAGIDSGWDALTEAEAVVGVAGHQHPNEWLYFPFNGHWETSTADYLVRGTASKRLHFLVDNHQSAYWATFTDSRPPKQRTRLSGANEYRVEFSTEGDVPVNYGLNGFWSVTLYDSTWFLVNSVESVYGVRGNAPGIPANFIISANCNGRANCVNAPAGNFQLLFRGYYPEAGLDAEGGYQLPKVFLCNKGCK
jgi:hypothetical protein